MAKEAKQALDQLCAAILKSSPEDINTLVEWSRELYENLVIMQYIYSQHPSNQENSENERESPLSVDTIVTNNTNIDYENSVDSNTLNNEINILQETDKDLINNLVENKIIHEKTDKKIVEKTINVHTSNISKSVYSEIKQEKIEISLTDSSLALNERLAASNKIALGLNDKIAFSRHLFNGDDQAMMVLIDMMNSAQTFEQAMNYLHQARAQYNAWEEKKDYVTRLENLVRRKFGKPEIIED